MEQSSALSKSIEESSSHTGIKEMNKLKHHCRLKYNFNKKDFGRKIPMYRQRKKCLKCEQLDHFTQNCQIKVTRNPTLLTKLVMKLMCQMIIVTIRQIRLR